MTWIKTEAENIINAAHLSHISVWEASRIRRRPHGSGTIEHHDAPGSGFCLIAWEGNSPHWLTDGHKRQVAEMVLQHLYSALEAQAPAFDVPALMAAIAPKITASTGDTQAT
jgi:hypothetical protein